MSYPNPIALSIGSINITWYGVLIASAFALALLLLLKRAPMYGFKADDIFDIFLVIIPCAIVGLRLFYVAFAWEAEDFASNPLRILYIWEGGLAVYGGIIGSAIGAYFFCKKRKLNFLDMCDLTFPLVALGQGIGRWGNFINQEAFGPLVSNPSLQFFPFSVFIERTQTWHMATFFYESFACVLIFLLLSWYAKRKPKHPSGNVLLWYCVLYGIERAFVEGLRTDSLYVGSLRISQVLSILLVVVCGGLLLYRFIKKRGDTVLADPRLAMRRPTPKEEDTP